MTRQHGKKITRQVRGTDYIPAEPECVVSRSNRRTLHRLVHAQQTYLCLRLLPPRALHQRPEPASDIDPFKGKAGQSNAGPAQRYCEGAWIGKYVNVRMGQEKGNRQNRSLMISRYDINRYPVGKFE